MQHRGIDAFGPGALIGAQRSPLVLQPAHPGHVPATVAHRRGAHALHEHVRLARPYDRLVHLAEETIQPAERTFALLDAQSLRHLPGEPDHPICTTRGRDARLEPVVRSGNVQLVDMRRDLLRVEHGGDQPHELLSLPGLEDLRDGATQGLLTRHCQQIFFAPRHFEIASLAIDQEADARRRRHERAQPFLTRGERLMRLVLAQVGAPRHRQQQQAEYPEQRYVHSIEAVLRKASRIEILQQQALQPRRRIFHLPPQSAQIDPRDRLIVADSLPQGIAGPVQGLPVVVHSVRQLACRRPADVHPCQGTGTVAQLPAGRERPLHSGQDQVGMNRRIPRQQTLGKGFRSQAVFARIRQLVERHDAIAESLIPAVVRPAEHQHHRHHEQRQPDRQQPRLGKRVLGHCAEGPRGPATAGISASSKPKRATRVRCAGLRRNRANASSTRTASSSSPLRKTKAG